MCHWPSLQSVGRDAEGAGSTEGRDVGGIKCTGQELKRKFLEEGEGAWPEGQR